MPEKQNFEFGVETKKILKLMIHSLYTNKDIVVRELISNASDACDKLRYQTSLNPDILGNETELKIKVEIDEEHKTLSIRDTGIGMNRDDLINQLGVIAKSGTEAFMEQISKNKEQDAIDLIGQFGVGFYSSFMIANKVQVISKKVDSDETYIWESTGEGEFKVKKYDEEFTRGTKVILYLKDGEDDFIDKFHIKHVIKSYSDHIIFPIQLKMGTTDDSVETINTGTALWTKNKQDITTQEYNDFYKYIAHMPGEPWMILHNKVEGNIEFTNLLFIPDRRTFDLFNPEMRTRIKLYIKRVFITEESVQLLPRYLRFIQGIVDSQDLPLNISRETLQYNSTVEKIKKALVKKIFTELEKKDQKEPEEYLKFWENFGPVMKEGLCEHNVNNDDLLDICKFYTSKAKDKPISLKTYIDRMKAEQKDIYYITGTSIDNIDTSPQVEGFKSKDIEVLYLFDTIDDFWVTATNKYKDHQFKSISRTDIDLDNLNPTEEQKADIEFEEEKKAREDKEKKEKLKNITESNYDGLIKLIKETLEKCNLKDVKISKKLTTSPVCLVADEKGLDLKLERFLLEQKQIMAPLPKVLEINVNHSIWQAVQNNLSNKDKFEDIKEVILTLFDEACVLEGEPVNNPADFARRLNKMMQFK
ncbi:MAG: molecular chaperone HtpG [Rickettsiales bacterium]|nr:molecular chaperone HtpG [Rickettsiales bacterium]